MLPDLRPEAFAPRVATEADADVVTRVLVDAFRGDPMWGTWAFPKPRSRRANRQGSYHPKETAELDLSLSATDIDDQGDRPARHTLGDQR